ncbi:Putative Acid ceramidase [Colletotrichum destructivum]|uniref:ceramidase n=1 Tax=Colletotrichum destructivum TaxID=34406 RepID=A0AAX4INJ5_9PEZI|nr:Putative Acid ceramidase [Colletotrichum destructivum]
MAEDFPVRAQDEKKQDSAFPTMCTPTIGDIPVYRIDMGKPAEERYIQLAKDFAPQIRSVSPLFDEVLESLFSKKLSGFFKFASRHAIRKVFSKEQTNEIKSIASTAKTSTHLVMALNLFLDLLLGCTSGAALVHPTPGKQSEKDNTDRLMHFRTLEWGMHVLRDLLVVVEFVNSKKGGKDEVIARSVTYAGFVGCLTGVRKDLSISLNFRPNHDCKTSSLRKHQLLVLLGRREAVPSILRRILLNEGFDDKKSKGSKDKDTGLNKHRKEPLTIAAAVKKLAFTPASPCYATFCDGSKVMTVLKDLHIGRAKTSTVFQVQCNHDPDHKVCCGHLTNTNTTNEATQSQPQAPVVGDGEWLYESENRQRALEMKWMRHMGAVTIRAGAALECGRNGICFNVDLMSETGADAEVPGVNEATLQQWIEAYPTTNECTHFSCIMDPVYGTIRWIARGPEASDSSVYAN